jgi:hypothetical protein
LSVEFRHLLAPELLPTGAAFAPALIAWASRPGLDQDEVVVNQAGAASAALGATSDPAVMQLAGVQAFSKQQRRQRVVGAVDGGSDPAAVSLLGCVLEALLVVPLAIGFLLQPGRLFRVAAAPRDDGTHSVGSRTGSNRATSNTSSSSSGSTAAEPAGAAGHSGKPRGVGTQETCGVYSPGLDAIAKLVDCTVDHLLAGLPPGMTTLGGLLAAVEAAALRVTQRLAPGAWCGALGCVNMAGCSEAELVAGRRRVVCGCCGVVSYCSPACLAADAAAGRLKHHRRLPGAQQAAATAGTPGV